jgi:predicted kinase
VSKLIITRGLSGSGKTTWAKDFCRWEPTYRFRVNRDDLRAMLYGGYAVASGYELEQLVTRVQHDTIRELLRRGKTVVADDTNLVLKHAREFARIAYEEGAQFEVNDSFLSVSVDVCEFRDGQRDSLTRVGKDVIRRQYDRFVKQGLQPVVYTPPAGQEVEPYVAPEYSDGTPVQKCILVDIDGTMALMNGREPYDWARVLEDRPNWPVVNLVKLIRDAAYVQGDESAWEIIFMSGREEVCRTETELWLGDLGFHDHKLFMRPTLPDGQRQPADNIVKLELFNQHIRYAYDVQFVLDDRDQVVEMWRKLGLTCLQVAPGAF